jgi:hypothetical protein
MVDPVGATEDLFHSSSACGAGLMITFVPDHATARDPAQDMQEGERPLSVGV